MKIAPIIAAMHRWEGEVQFEPRLVHTGQHYDVNMSDVFLQELGLPQAAHYLGCGSGSHAVQTAAVMVAFERVLVEQQPALVVVPGDVNSTMAAALVAAKLHAPVARVEAGLCSRDLEMPKELDRIIADHSSRLLFAPSRDADENLIAESISRHRIRFVGNTMIDSLDHCREALVGRSHVLADLALDERGYVVVTLHRPSNVDGDGDLRRMADILREIAAKIPVVYPVHPRAQRRVQDLLGENDQVRLIEPLGYSDFLALVQSARLVLTDSGGLQEETTVLGVPCLTARESTERPITISEGTNRLIPPSDPEGMLVAVWDILAAEPDYRPRRPELWDGRAGERIVAAIAAWFAGSQTPQGAQAGAARLGRGAGEEVAS